jgi:predicted Rossmann-fold nucleotide-binding protein
MEAANEGVLLADPSGGKRSLGIRVDLPFEQEVNAFVTKAYEHRTFFTRLHHFVLVSDAFVVVPGGIGTVLETMMVWQLLQVQKLHNTPLILAGQMYVDLVAWCRKHMLQPDCPLASLKDVNIPICVNDGPSILRIIHDHHSQWTNRRDSQKPTS